MMKYSGIAIGGPADRMAIENGDLAIQVFQAPIDGEDSATWYDYHNIDGIGVWFVRGAALGDSLKVVLESYAQPEPAHGGGERATERSVIQSMSERIEELKADVSKGNEENNELIYQQREVRRLCATAGVEDRGATVPGLVGQLVRQLDEARASARSTNASVVLLEKDRLNFIARLWGALTGEALPVNLSPDSVSALEEESVLKVKRILERLGQIGQERETLRRTRMDDVVDAVKAVLESTGHAVEGRTLDHQVDSAIDRERTRHSESLTKIADALQMTFAVMPTYSDTADAIVNVIKGRERMQLPSQLAALEKRVTTLERSKTVTVQIAGSSGGGGGGGKFGTR